MEFEKGSNPKALLKDVLKLIPEEFFDIFQLYFQFNQLKRIYRKGWLKHNISHQACESDADHSLGVAFLGLILANKYAPSLNQEKLLKMAVLHELGEIIIGDVTPDEETDYSLRKTRERNAVKEILGNFPGTDEMLALLDEFENKTSPEGQFMKEIDSLEMALQAIVYEKEFSLDLTNFIQSARKKVKLPNLEKILSQIEKLQSKDKNKKNELEC